MSRYDWSWNRSYDPGYRPRPMRDYGSNFGGQGGGGWWGGPGAQAPWGSGFGQGWGGAPRPNWQRPRYDRGEYGDFYPAYGGYPGDVGRGMYYGGDQFDRGQPPQGGSWGAARGYDRGMVREPFLPESAYQRHPELAEPRRSFDDWPGSRQPEFGEELSDEEIRSAVRQNLFNDNWIDAERIQVEVSEQVVTLTGEVDDYLEARYAWDDAWEAPGVRGVINQLSVLTEPEPSAPAKTAARKSTK
ncbi:MAG: BON domain-containing protein [Gemmatimonadetes bacterium]|nr:BON domain-containing protein [Gemmatimonadota bacterium]